MLSSRKMIAGAAILGFAYAASYAYMWLGIKSVGLDESSENYNDALTHRYLTGTSSAVRLSSNKDCSLDTGQIWIERSHVLKSLKWTLSPKITAGKIYFYHIPVEAARCASKDGLYPINAKFMDGTTASTYGQPGDRFLEHVFAKDKMYTSFELYLSDNVNNAVLIKVSSVANSHVGDR